jgi:energy-coupling factor transporter transmembrane protein EcfT
MNDDWNNSKIALYSVLAILVLMVLVYVIKNAPASFFISLIPLGLFIALLWFIYRTLFPGPGPIKFCSSCGHEGETTKQTRGSLALEIFLWLLFLLPGFLYSIWRHTTRKNVCSECGADTVIPVNSPIANATRKRLGQEI